MISCERPSKSSARVRVPSSVSNRYVLPDRDPGQLAALARQLVSHPGVLLLALKQLAASGLPLRTADNLVICHRVLP